MKKVVVAIDFGTSGTTYAFAFSHQKENIITGKWNINQEKNPTEIILDDTLKIIKFGNECKDYLGEQSSSENTFYYYKDIKMELYKNKKEILADNGSVKLPLAIVISKILRKIKEKALKDIKAREPLISENDIEWKVTVPAIWKNESKDIMKKACESAGIFNKEQESTFFALEPEAAACDYLMNHPSEKAIVPGTTYIVLDIGGGTVDISTHKRIEENGEIYIEEAYPPIGGDNGSTYINKKFIEEVIQNLFGQDAMNTLLERVKNPSNKKDFYDDYCDLLDSSSIINKWNTQNVNNLSGMFQSCFSLKELPDISSFDTSNVNNMSDMFSACSSLTSLPDISKWDTSNVNNMSFMFSSCCSLTSLPDISKWVTQNVNNLSGMFQVCSSLESLPDISKWETKNVNNMSWIFSQCSELKALPDISKWNTENVLDMKLMFNQCNSLEYLPDISKWKTQKVINMSGMFQSCQSLHSLPDISKWDTKNVTDLSFMFSHCLSLTSLPNISRWDIRNARNRKAMFINCNKNLYIPPRFQLI